MANTFMEGKKSQDLVNLILAVCLFISPWVVGFVSEITPTWNAWVVGIALGALTITALSAFAEWEEWANLALGLWLVASPWLLGFAANAGAMRTSVILGVLIAAVAAWAVWGVHHPQAHA